MAGFDNDILFCPNVDFVGASTPHVGQITTDGQLLVGSTALPNIRTGILTSPGTSITIGYVSPNITLDVNGAAVGQTITGDAGGALSPTAGNWNIFGGVGISTSGVGSTLTINSTGGMDWNTTAVNVANMAVNNGYFCIAAGGNLTLGLPAVSALGDVVSVSLDGATSWQITQAAGQQIRVGSSTTTLGAAGTLTSTAQGDSVELVCRVANTLWVVQSTMGNLTVA